MPLKSGKSQATIGYNIRELHGGKTYKRTMRKFGKKRADRQSVAIAMEKAGLSRDRKKQRTGLHRLVAEKWG